ncbi:EscU/YscU/HrcU family type III secretion system export apparatus switch protein [Azospirillum sp. 11R-A]|uniref:EscU/YscU/HrcU family type III secretion system export apparatus switch protein n=1 Tax=Azospirillum sp. 11R-A TaxID=3111634 RepID=UPI003C23C83E
MSAQARPPASSPAGKTAGKTASSARRPAQRPVAVALKYELGTESLPRIVATGKGTVAEQILEVAFANGVKVREDADLVEILSAIEVDSDIPVEAIAAVAEILAYVYRANGTLPPEPRSEESPEEDTP